MDTTKRPRRTVEAYRDELLALVEPLVSRETVPLALARGRVLAEPGVRNWIPPPLTTQSPVNCG